MGDRDMSRRGARRRSAPGSRGQALAEMGLVVVLLTFLLIGIVEVGFAFGRTNMLVHAARDGARFGATLDPSMRDANGCFDGAGTAAIQTHVSTVLDSIGFEATSIGVTQGCEGTVPVITVTITGTLDLMFDLIGTSVEVDRSATFQDEIRLCAGGGGAC